MAQYQILLLPLSALALIIFFPLLETDASLSRSWRSTRRRRILFGRITVVVLLIAALVTVLRPIGNLNSLVQGVLLTLAMLIPVGAVFCAFSIRHSLRRKRASRTQQSRKQSQGSGPVLAAEKLTLTVTPDKDDTLSPLLNELDTNELKKLVIEQQSSIENERRAHRRSRTLSRDALIVMRGARSAQKDAEKLARRERLKRKRLERQYENVDLELDSTLSLVRK